jgi:hypothetical protein
MEIFSDQITKIFVVAASRTRALFNSVLTVRWVYPSTMSQTTAEACSYVFFDALLDQRMTYVSLRNIFGMVVKPFRNASARWSWQRTCAPGEGQDCMHVLHTQTSKPFLNGYGYLRTITDLPTRESNITEGYAQVLQLVRHPISTTRAASGNPAADYPTTMLLRQTRGNETSPYCLPNSSMGIDSTPMGLLPFSFRIGRGTY